jgi:hypothetical protein
MFKNGKLVEPIASIVNAMRVNPTGSFGGYTAGMNDSILSDWGIYKPLIERGAQTRAHDADGVYLPFATDGTDNYVASVRIFASLRAPHQPAAHPVMVAQVRLVDLSAVRFSGGPEHGHDHHCLGADHCPVHGDDHGHQFPGARRCG